MAKRFKDWLSQAWQRFKAEKELLQKAVYLDKLYQIPARYPNGFESGASADFYTDKDAVEAIGNAGLHSDADIMVILKQDKRKMLDRLDEEKFYQTAN